MPWERTRHREDGATVAEYSKAVRQLGEPDGMQEPSRRDDEVTTVTFKLPKSTLERLNARAKELGVTRSFLIRKGVTEVLAGGAHSRISKLVLVTSFETYDENGAPMEHSRVAQDDGSNAKLTQLVSELAESANELAKAQQGAAE